MLLMLASVCATIAHSRRGEALSCAPPMERYALTVVSVTVGGAPVSELGPWQGYEVRMNSNANGSVSVFGYRPGEEAFRLLLEPQP